MIIEYFKFILFNSFSTIKSILLEKWSYLTNKSRWNGIYLINNYPRLISLLSRDWAKERKGEKKRENLSDRSPFLTIVNYPRGIMERNDDGWKWGNRYSWNGFDDRQQYNTYHPVSTTFIWNHFNSRWERKRFHFSYSIR